MENFYSFIDNILSSNFNNSSYKYTYLYNELFISIYMNNEFVLFGVSYKANKMLINKYTGYDTKYGKILLVIFKKYENVFLKMLENLNKNLFNIGKESEFINIYDKKELGFNEIKTKLGFTFLDDYSYRRKIPDNFNFESSILGIYHSDYECSKCNGPKDTFSNFIDYSKIIDEKYFKSNIDKKVNILYTNITDYESITIGGNEKINDILQEKKELDKYDLITLNQTCISVIIGDDPKSIFKQNNIPPNKIFYTNQETDSNYRTLIKFLKNIDINLNNKNNKTNEIIFFGLNKIKNTYEINMFIEKNFGIKVSKVLIPSINIKDLQEILDYKLGVFFTGREIKLQNMFKLYPLNQIEESVPYGTTKMEILLGNIFKKLGKEEYIIKLKNIFQEYKNKHDDLYEKVNNYQLGFIIYSFHIKQFIKDNFRGVPIISLLGDMGFKINFFVYIDDKENIDNLDSIEELKKYGFNIIISRDKEDLKEFINNKKIQIYYSEISNDKRILSSNKEQFSVGDFEYGIEGFYRSFKLLIKKCEKVDYSNFKLNYYINK